MNAVETGILALGQQLKAQGRVDDAQILFDHLASLRPQDPQAAVWRSGGAEPTLAALQRLAAQRASGLKAISPAEVEAHANAGVTLFNQHMASGATETAEAYAAALAEVLPNAVQMLDAAMGCNRTLGRFEKAVTYAQKILAIEPDHFNAHQLMADVCKALGEADGEIGHRLGMALSSSNPSHALLKLRDIHDVASAILCRPLTERSELQLSALLNAAARLDVQAEPGTEWQGWEKHYRLLLQGVDMTAVRGPTPPAASDDDVEYADARGLQLGLVHLRKMAEAAGAEAVFFAAADEAYVELYARWYALSVLKHSDVPCVVVIHVIGGAGRLAEIAAKVGIDDPRLMFAADRFDAAWVATRCYDAPPKGLIDKPVAHYQSVRFQRLGSLLAALQRPVFVSDIDLLLQRGVADLLARCASDDVVFNENAISHAAGSRLTANLVLVRPTESAQAMLRWLRAYLDRALAGAEVTRWIDQLALILARHHLAFRQPQAQLGYFDTSSDINNVMYPSYQEHPFRFLSLYHGFDTSSLEGDPRVLGDAETSAPKKARTRKAK
ncbi:hypothetical protein [Phenylobacterium deserti]|uniref:Tetratricopeptide repeat protein n=1 Tax=Phenylobacterium deserti TaxID=1914756 RepID=A0A328AV87_9CAUL|nr:hypothetical protein [Phenylobacterium deserti]RAK58125.1 hypothetical protein DJ018_09525 [Phenylobacterium deserti]